MIGWSHHEDPTFIEPHYRDVASLYAALLEAYQQHSFDLARDYLSDISGDREAQVFAEHLAAFDLTLDEPLRKYHGAFLLSLCPVGREAELLPLLHDQELALLAGNLLASRGCHWALEALIAAVREHSQDLTVSSNLLQAITKLDAPGTDDALIALARGYPVTLSASSLATALERRGFPQQRPRNAQNQYDHSLVKLDSEPGGWLVLRWA